MVLKESYFRNFVRDSLKMLDCSIQIEAEKSCVCVEFKPSMRSGVWSDIGPRSVMEDDHVVIDNLIEHLGSIAGQDSGAYYGVSFSTYFLPLYENVKWKPSQCP